MFQDVAVASGMKIAWSLYFLFFFFLQINIFHLETFVGDCDAAGLDQCFQTLGHGSVKKNMVFVPLSYETTNQRVLCLV